MTGSKKNIVYNNTTNTTQNTTQAVEQATKQAVEQTQKAEQQAQQAVQQIQHTLQEAKPIGEQAPLYSWLWNAAQGAANNVQGKGYTGNWLAPMGTDFTKGMDFLRANASSLAAGADPTRQLASDTISGKFLSPDSNPFLSAAMTAAIDPIRKTVMRSLLPAIMDQSNAAGAYGGARQDIAEQQVMNEFAGTAGNITASMAAENYARERALQMQAPALFAQAAEMSRMPGVELMALGEAQKSADQIALENARLMEEERRRAQFYGLGELANILQAGGFKSQAGTITGNTAGTSGQQTTGSSSGTTTGTMTGNTVTNMTGTQQQSGVQPNPNYQPPAAQWTQGIMGGLGLLGSMFMQPAGGLSAAAGLANLFR